MGNSTKAEITDAIDEVISTVLVPTLKDAGFRKTRRHWSHSTEEVARAVSVGSSLRNIGARGSFGISFGVSYIGLGEPRPKGPDSHYCQHRESFGHILPNPRDADWRFEDASDPAERSDMVARVWEKWREYGVPFLATMADPVSYLTWLVDRSVAGSRGLEALDLALALGDERTANLVLDGYLWVLRTNRLAPDDWQGNPYPLGWLTPFYVRVRPHLAALGRGLEDADRDRAVETLGESLRALANGCQLDQWDRPELARGLIEHGEDLGVDVRSAMEAAGLVDLKVESLT